MTRAAPIHHRVHTALTTSRNFADCRIQSGSATRNALSVRVDDFSRGHKVHFSRHQDRCRGAAQCRTLQQLTTVTAVYYCNKKQQQEKKWSRRDFFFGNMGAFYTTVYILHLRIRSDPRVVLLCSCESQPAFVMYRFLSTIR